LSAHRVEKASLHIEGERKWGGLRANDRSANGRGHGSMNFPEKGKTQKKKRTRSHRRRMGTFALIGEKGRKGRPRKAKRRR